MSFSMSFDFVSSTSSLSKNLKILPTEGDPVIVGLVVGFTTPVLALQGQV